MKHPATLLFLFIAFTTMAQKNAFLDRNFWNENPSLETVKKLVEDGNDPTAFNPSGFDATTFALLARTNNEVVRYLLSLKENRIDKRTHDSRIYLHWAAMGGDPENISTLLEMGSDVNAKDSRGSTPLIFAAASGLTNPEVYNLFAKKGVKLKDQKNPQGANLLLLASPFFDSIESVDYFINQGMDLKSTDNEGNNIFNYAARRGNVELLQQLIDRGIEYKKLNKNGGNAFMFASQGTRGFTNSIGVYKFLLDKGLNPNVVTTDGSTPLHRIALSKADDNIFELFIEQGANVDQQDSEGNTPFLNVCSRGNIKTVDLFLKKSKDITVTNKKGQTALMLAVAHNSPEIVDFLLQNKINPQATDAAGNNLGYYLVESFNSRETAAFDKKMDILKGAGVKLNAIQAEKNTLLHLAARADQPELLKIVSTLDVPLTAVNAEGLTALHVAAMKAKDPSTLRILVAMGADIKATTEFGETAYELAMENELLKKYKEELNFLN